MLRLTDGAGCPAVALGVLAVLVLPIKFGVLSSVSRIKGVSLPPRTVLRCASDLMDKRLTQDPKMIFSHPV